jgi:hypothetical protein
MSVKVALSGISSILELALVPIKLAFGRSEPTTSTTATRKVVLVNRTSDGVCVESAVCLGEAEACNNAAIELIQAKRTIALEGFQIEEVAALCFKHNYRWRLDDSPSKRSRFVIEPCVVPLQSDNAPRKAHKAPGSD